jgi:streptomycin 6-kinase
VARLSGVADLELPRNLIAGTARYGDARQRAWIAALPETVDALARHWSLEVDAPFQPGGQTAWVAPARNGALDLVLKVGLSDTEAAHEADGLREWDGDGAARLLEAMELGDAVAMLIERCVPGSALAERPEIEQDTVIADVLLRLWREPAPGHRFRPLQQMCDQWADEFDQKVAAGRLTLDPGIAREGIALFRSLPASAERNVLLCTDLHAGNVLAAEREPWLMIDPKPYVGDPTYDALQHLLNCSERLQADPHGLARRMADLLDLDAERVLRWLFARCVQEFEWPGMVDIAHRLAPT